MNNCFTLHLGDCFCHKLAIEVVAHGSNVATLCFAQQVSCTTNLKVTHCDFESAAKVCGFTDCAETFVCVFRQCFVARVKEICVRALSAATNATTQLMHLSKTQKVRTFDNQSVYGRHVDAAFNNGGADKNVVVAFPEIENDLFKLRLVHLAVCDSHASLWYPVANFCCALFN